MQINTPQLAKLKVIERDNKRTCPTTAANGKYCLPYEMGFSGATPTAAPLADSRVAAARMRRRFLVGRFGFKQEERIGYNLMG